MCKNKAECLNINNQVDLSIRRESPMFKQNKKNKTSWSCLGFNHQVDTPVYAEVIQSLNETPKKIKQNV